MSSRRGGRGGRGRGHQHQNKEKRPPLTHFLCLPLINPTSLPQLVSSLAEFKEAIPLNTPSQPNSLKPATRLLPDDALRPVGTLHFTLGVMSLTSEERLQEALNFLQSLDLTSILQDVESELSTQGTKSSETPLEPLKISLTSLDALPKARDATILHAGPSDPTSRLYPFSQRLRNKFIEAGFILEETEVKKDKAPAESADPDPGNNELVAEGSVRDEPAKGEEETPRPQTQKIKTRRPRPLLLHATVANTIYMGRRRQAGSGKKDTYRFDARELLGRFRDYHGEKASAGDSRKAADEQKPFVWARDFPLEKLCVCEMGAKDIPEEDMKRRFLGQEYRAVGERKLEFARS
jgi:activating signal cointegrator complex subunit 1